MNLIGFINSNHVNQQMNPKPLQKPFKDIYINNVKQSNVAQQQLSICSYYEVDPEKQLQKFECSNFTFTFQQTLTYEKLLNQYDRILLFDLNDQRLLMHQVILIQIELQPQNMFWIIWRNSQEIFEFLEDIEDEIIHINKVKQLEMENGRKIVIMYNELIKKWELMAGNQQNKLYGTMDINLVNLFIEWLYEISKHEYLRKNIDFLIFINHCLPMDKWNLHVYQQLFVRKPFGLIDKLHTIISDDKIKRKKQYFLTITSDGIIKSDDHLLLSKVDTMIPFTNLMSVKQQRNGNSVVYNISSGSQSWQIDFHENYVDAINFACGLGRARIDAFYKASFKNNNEQFKSYLRQDYVREQKQNTVPHRFDSFTPPRQNCSIKLYNDGCGYFEDLYGCLMNAKYQICITDWMMSPYFLLRRPGSIDDENTNNRFDGVLEKAAIRGVKIFIILFMQPSMFLNNDSEGAAKHLENLHKNIKILRHPNVAVPIIWSHHEKLCVIDQKIGFMGGLDICYGRWDTPQHKLVQVSIEKSKKLWDGCDFNNFRTKDICEPRQYQKSNLHQDFQVRMPWHDIALQMRGDSVIDLLRHFVQYWYFVKSEYKFSPRKIFKSFKNRQAKVKKHHIGKQIKQTTQEYFQEKWQLIKQEVTDEFFPGHERRISELLIQQRTGMNTGSTRIQMLRSANNWSIGANADKPQRSIHEAYKELIQQAQSHIYIENQFFMGLKNEIVKTLCERITRAFYEKKPFKVIIVVPLLPGFEGDPGSQQSTVLRIQIHWQKVAILTGQDSIYNTLQKTCPGIKITDYLFFFGLRTWDILHGSPITQIIYVHSKLMIVDDKRGICGSANINDRSLWGTGDSEIAVCIQQSQASSNKGQLFDLRCRIYDQHFKLTKQQCLNIISKKVWQKILRQAKLNTLIYRQVFGCIPDDEVTTHQQIQMLAEQATYDHSKLHQIIGHAVEYPLKFMDDEDLTFSIGQKQYYAPVESFT